MTPEKDLAHVWDMRRLAREQLRLDCDPYEVTIIETREDERVPCEPWPLEDLEF